jgi:large subunit ribosomal protein L18
MRAIHAPKGRPERRYRRHLRVRQKVAGHGRRPRLVVYRSLKHIYAQLVDDDRGAALLGVSTGATGSHRGHGQDRQGQGGGDAPRPEGPGAGITTVVFDRAGYQYHGRVKALAEGAREGGLEF